MHQLALRVRQRLWGSCFLRAQACQSLRSVPQVRAQVALSLAISLLDRPEYQSLLSLAGFSRVYLIERLDRDYALSQHARTYLARTACIRGVLYMMSCRCNAHHFQLRLVPHLLPVRKLASSSVQRAVTHAACACRCTVCSRGVHISQASCLRCCY